MRLFLSLFLIPIVAATVLLHSPVIGMEKDVFLSESQVNSSLYSFVVSKNDTGAWFYNIKNGQKVIIIQKTIPAINGNIAFADTTDAALIAQLMVDKLNAGIFPPSISMDELNRYNIKF